MPNVFDCGHRLNPLNSQKGACIGQGVLIQVGCFSAYAYTTCMVRCLDITVKHSLTFLMHSFQAVELWYVLGQRDFDTGSRIKLYHAAVWVRCARWMSPTVTRVLRLQLLTAVDSFILAGLRAYGEGGDNEDQYIWCWVHGSFVARFVVFLFPVLIAWSAALAVCATCSQPNVVVPCAACS